MKKKLFIWAYTHNPGFIETCGIDADGKMIFTIQRERIKGDSQKTHEENIRLLIADNQALSAEYDIHVQNQRILENHIYHGGERNLLPKDFRIAWDRYQLGETITN